MEASIDNEIENFYLRSFGDLSDIKLVEFNPEKGIDEIEIESEVGIITNTFSQNQIEKTFCFPEALRKMGI